MDDSLSKNLSGIVREIELTANELEAENSPKQFVIPGTEDQGDLIINLVEGEGEAIMANLTGFGNPVRGESVSATNNRLSQARSQQQPYLRIVEQPAYNKLRFRYECEGRSAGALVGENTKDKNRTYPTIQILGYRGPAVVVVSCVEDKPPYRTHPHNLVGRDGVCKKGVCSMDINNDEMICSFQNLGIQCVRRKDAPDSLSQRQMIRVDPFKQGFAHKNSAVNLNAVRLCFQAFLKPGGDTLSPLQPVVSNVIVDRKVHTDLHIYDHSDDWSTVDGGKKIIILTERLCKDNIEVHFNQCAEDGSKIWHSKADFGPSAVHKQFAISFQTPPYYNKDIKQPVKVSMQLFKPSENTYSDGVDFRYVPVDYFSFNRPPPFQEEQRQPEAKKRGKPPGQQDDLSSGQVLGPQKISTAQLRHGGGAVTIIGDEKVDVTNQRRLNEEYFKETSGRERLKDIQAEFQQANADPAYQGYQQQQYPLYEPAVASPPQQQQNPQQPVEDTNIISLDNMNMSDFVDLGLSDNMGTNLIIQDGGHHQASQSRPMYSTQTSQLQTPDISGNMCFSENDLKRNDLNKL